MEIYKLGRELSGVGWVIYEKLDWRDKKIIGDQFIEATDSFGANFTEGYARFHFLDRVKFCYNARGSLSEADDYWMELMKDRRKVEDALYVQYKQTAAKCRIKLQNYISSIYRNKNK